MAFASTRGAACYKMYLPPKAMRARVFYHGLVSVVVSSWGNDMSMHVVQSMDLQKSLWSIYLMRKIVGFGFMPQVHGFIRS